MQQLRPVILAALLLCATSVAALAQEPDTTQPVAPDTTQPTSVDPDLLGLPEAGCLRNTPSTALPSPAWPFLDKDIVLSISGLQKGDKVTIPGTDAFSKAITKLWRQRFFSDVQIFITNMTEDAIALEISLYRKCRSWAIINLLALKKPKLKSWKKRSVCLNPPSSPKTRAATP
jgi:outer membrane protein insertion porin family